MERLFAPWRLAFIESGEKQPGCIFCRFPAEESDRENLVLGRSARSFVILNKYPYNNGHLMVIPRDHVSDPGALSEDDFVDLQRLLRLSIAVLREVYGSDGLNVGMNLGRAAGAGIADHWLGNAEDPRHWRDIQIRVEGPAVVPLQTGFAQNWLQTTHELISGPLYFPAPVPAGPLNVQTIMSSPEAVASSVRILYYLSIICARRSIFIANPYFIPDQSAIDILIEAKQRGVDVRIMVSGINNDNWLARHNSVRLFRRLLKAGIEIREYNRTMLHHKTMVVDDIWATVGTTNFDNRSFAHNEETNVCVYDREIARVLRQVFMADLEACARVELRTWRRRGLWTKTQEVIASVLQEQI